MYEYLLQETTILANGEQLTKEFGVKGWQLVTVVKNGEIFYWYFIRKLSSID